MTIEHRGGAGSIIFNHVGADLGCRCRISQGSRNQPQLHAETIGAFLDHDDRLQRRQRRIRPRFEQAAPQRTQPADRIRATDIDPEFGAIDCNLGQGRRRRVREGFFSSRLVGGGLVRGRRGRGGLRRKPGRRRYALYGW